MWAVIFEVQPKRERRQEYLDIAARLRPDLDGIDGFLSVERFASAAAEERLLSVSFWRDAAALAAWRHHAPHRQAQALGRSAIFADYRLRVGQVLRGFAANPADAVEADGAQAAPQPGRIATVLEATGPAARPAPDGGSDDGLLSEEAFHSIYTPGKQLWLRTWQALAPAMDWSASVADGLGGADYRLRLVAIARDYGPVERAEAPRS